MNITMILQIATIVSAVLMVIAILLQQRGASLGAGFGGSGELYSDDFFGSDICIINYCVARTAKFVIMGLVCERFGRPTTKTAAFRTEP